MALLVNSLRLSLTIIFGLPRSAMRRSNSRANRRPDSDVSATSAGRRELIGHEVQRPALVWLQRLHGALAPITRLRPPRERTAISPRDKAGTVSEFWPLDPGSFDFKLR